MGHTESLILCIEFEKMEIPWEIDKFILLLLCAHSVFSGFNKAGNSVVYLS